MAIPAPVPYSSTIEKGDERTPNMNMQLGLRTLALLALVIASTAVLVKPELIGGPGASTAPTIAAMLVVGHN
jgi:hypothetical protein